jgi:hypothetical protein
MKLKSFCTTKEIGMAMCEVTSGRGRVNEGD